MSALPAYSGRFATCPKCRAVARTGWHRSNAVAWLTADSRKHELPCKHVSGLDAPLGKGRHLCRICPDCGYGWVERCKDTDIAGRPEPPNRRIDCES